MRMVMRLTALLLMGSGVVSAQSLAEVAKKERDRRARNAGTENDEPIRVIGDEELSRASGEGVSVIGPRPDAGSSTEGESSPAGDTPEPELSESEIRELRATWSRVWPERMRAAEKELELAEDDVFQCQSAAHYFFVPLAVDCNRVYERRAIAEYRVKELRQNRYNWELLLPERQRPPPLK